MSYNTLITMSQDGDLRARFVAAATGVGIVNPQQWVDSNILVLAADPDVNAAYASALTAYTQALAAVPSAAIGKRDDVVADNNILNAVNAINPTV